MYFICCIFCISTQCLNQTIEVFKLLTDAAYPSKHDQNCLIAKVRLYVSSTKVYVDTLK